MKFCPKCGTPFESGKNTCEKCGYQLVAQSTNKLVENATIQSTIATSSAVQTKAHKKTIKIIYCILAIAVTMMCFYSASCIVNGGLEISSIQSVGGQTLEEAYYQSLGAIYSGYAMAIRAFGIFSAAILIHLGSKE